MFNRKLAVSIAAAFMSVGLLAGCSSGDPAASPTATSSEEGGVIDPTYTPRPTTTGSPTIGISEEDPGSGEDDTGINIEPSNNPSTTPTSGTTTGPGGFTAPPTSGPVPSTKPTDGGSENFVATCDEVTGTIAKDDARYRLALDPNGNGIACEPSDRNTLNNPGTRPTTNPTTSPTRPGSGGTPAPEPTTGGTSGEPAPTKALPVPDNTVILAKINSNTKIYASPNVNSKVIGEATSGGQFKGTVVNGGYWVKVDRSPGYVRSDPLSVARTLN